jgi:hypothetical protein
MHKQVRVKREASNPGRTRRVLVVLGGHFLGRWDRVEFDVTDAFPAQNPLYEFELDVSHRLRAKKPAPPSPSPSSMDFVVGVSQVPKQGFIVPEGAYLNLAQSDLGALAYAEEDVPWS